MEKGMLNLIFISAFLFQIKQSNQTMRILFLNKNLGIFYIRNIVLLGFKI